MIFTLFEESFNKTQKKSLVTNGNVTHDTRRYTRYIRGSEGNEVCLSLSIECDFDEASV